MDVLEPKYYAAIGMVMTLIAVIFLFLMGSALVHSTKSFWQGYSTEYLADKLLTSCRQEVNFLHARS